MSWIIEFPILRRAQIVQGLVFELLVVVVDLAPVLEGRVVLRGEENLVVIDITLDPVGSGLEQVQLMKVLCEDRKPG